MCMDTFYDIIRKNRFPVFVKCTKLIWPSKIDFGSKESSNYSSTRTIGFGKIGYEPINKIIDNGKIVKKILKVPKCCPKDKVFDVNSKSCLDSGFTDIGLVFGKDYKVDSYTGIVFCSNVQVDYTISTHHISIDNENIVVSSLIFVLYQFMLSKLFFFV